LGLIVFFIILLAILRKSKFASLGSLRSARQRISYEIRLRFIIFSPFVLLHSLIFWKFYYRRLTLRVLVFLLWWITCLMECNRAPFDFAEGERELIRGFNVEYSSLGFVFIFLGEYGIILLFSILTSIMFFNRFTIFIILFMSLIVVRTSYPRFRYDLIIEMCWLIVLPFRILFIFCLLYV
jgi:NADH-ubiquinone oxidoreductase chain 1